jgi:hypothetical protein
MRRVNTMAVCALAAMATLGAQSSASAQSNPTYVRLGPVNAAYCVCLGAPHRKHYWLEHLHGIGATRLHGDLLRNALSQ